MAKLVKIKLTQKQWNALLNMADRGINDAEYYAHDGWADQDDHSGKYRKKLEKSADRARAALQAVWEQTKEDKEEN